MPLINDEHGGHRPPPDYRPTPPNTAATPHTIDGLTAEQAAQQARIAAARANQTPAQQLYAALTDTVERQREHVAAVGAEYEQHRNADYAKQKIVEFASTTAGQMPTAVEQTAAKMEAHYARERDALRGGMLQDGDTAEEIRRDRMLRQFRERFDHAESVGAKVALAQQVMANGDRSTRALVADECRAALDPAVFEAGIERPLAAMDPELAEAERRYHDAQLCHQTLSHAAGMVSRGIKTGSPPTTLGTLADVVHRYDPAK